MQNEYSTVFHILFVFNQLLWNDQFANIICCNNKILSQLSQYNPPKRRCPCSSVQDNHRFMFLRGAYTVCPDLSLLAFSQFNSQD